ncbi:MAG: hypothetical protein K0R17_2296 [Rariglobus sp.]|jgi:uncharacterized protein involved in outer membrane biogenesis|nr:hypothetical protein [Rariglobus sp.]
MSLTPQPSAASIVARDKRRRRLRRRRLLALGAVAGFLLFCFFGLPPIIKAQAIKHLSAELHREVAIEKIRLNPLTLSITIEGLAIKDRDGGPFTGWRRLYVNFDSFSLFTGEWRFQEIALDGFSQRVTVSKEGVFNFADLIPPSTQTPAAPEPADAKPPRPIRIASLSVTSAAFAFADASRGQPFATEMGPLSFTLQNFLTAGDPKAPYEFSAITEAGETFAWKGTVSIDPVRSAGEFSIGKITLKKYAPYYADRINADLLDGLLDVSARYAIDLAEGSRQLALTDASIKLSRLQVAARGSTTPLIDLPSFTIEGLSADGLKPSATINRIALDGGRLTVVRERDGSINLLNLLATAATSGTSPAATPAVSIAPAGTAPGASPVPAALPDVRLTEFALSGLAIDFEDRTTPTPATNNIGRLDVSVKNLVLAEAAAPVIIKLSAATLPSGTLEVEGTAVREPLAADLAVKITALPLAGATPYIEPMLNIRVVDGAVSVDGFARMAGTVAGFQGNVSVDKFATIDGAKGEDFVKFTQLAIRGIDATSEPLTAKISEISLADPLARVAIHADKSTNLAVILRSDRPAAEAAPAPATVAFPAPGASPASAAAAPVWSLGKFTLTNGAATLSDRSVKPAARLSLDHFSGTVTGLSSADLQRADVEIRGKVNGTGTVALTGKLDAKAATPAPGALTELVIDVKGVDLSPISPYIGTYAGYELARSGLAVDVKARLAQRKLDTANVLTLQQFTLGAATNSPEATKLPVRLGIALLKDMDGNIVIDLPVKGDLDDPSFKIGRVVLRVITNLLVKAATSPFSLIGAAFGGGGDELAYQDFAAGAVTPLEAELKKIDTLRKALKGRPALNLDITGSYDAGADLAAVRDRTLMKQVRFRLWEELRAKNPDTPPPTELTVSPEDEARIVGLFVAERYPGGAPVVGADGGVEPPPPLIKPFPQTQPQPRSTGPIIRRNQRVFAGLPPSKSKTVPKPEPAKPVVFAPVDGAVAPAPDGAAPLTLADARSALAAGIPVSDDELRQLAADRAQRVRDALLEGGEIDAGRLFLSPPAPEGKGAKVFLQLR